MSPAESLREKLIYFLEPGITYKKDPAERRAEAGRLVDEYAHELAEQQRAYAEEEWTGSDARMILRRRVARHLADLIDPGAGPVRPDEEPTP